MNQIDRCPVLRLNELTELLLLRPPTDARNWADYILKLLMHVRTQMVATTKPKPSSEDMTLLLGDNPSKDNDYSITRDFCDKLILMLAHFRPLEGGGLQAFQIMMHIVSIDLPHRIHQFSQG